MTNSEPVVSIILLCYNQESSVGTALDSLVAQKCNFPFEIVVADDCSTDSTRDICEDYARRHPDIIRILPNEPNKGLVLNYFNALRNCRGRYVTDCAGDDRWLGDNRMNLCVERLENNPDLMVAFTDVILYNTMSGTRTRAYATPAYRRWAQKSIPSDELILGILNRAGALPYILSAAIYRRDAAIMALDDNPGLVCNPSFACEDLPLMAALATKGGASFVDEVTLEYSISEDSISNNKDLRKLLNFYLNTFRATRILATGYGVDIYLLKSGFHSKALYLLSLALKAGSELDRERVEHEIRQWHIPLTAKERLYIAANRHGFLRSMIVSAKKYLGKD